MLIKKILKTLAYIIAVVFIFALLVFVYINFPVSKNKEKIPLGVTFSMRYATDIGLDWKQAYIAMLDDLQIKNIRIPVYWDMIEKEEGRFDFTDIDWQLEQAYQRKANVILVVGQKVPRWPECFIPEWANEKQSREDAQVLFIQTVVNRYKNYPAVQRWQVENEPFLDFGICPVLDPNLLDREIAAVKEIDSTRPVVVTDSGELSLWINAAKRADVFGSTMYRDVWTKEYGHWRYPIGPNFFKIKKQIIKLFAAKKDFVVIELQGEPWVQGWTVHAPLSEQLDSMNSVKLKDNVEFAKKTKPKEIYIWGVEWWYWLKTTQGDSSVWDAAREKIKENAL